MLKKTARKKMDFVLENNKKLSKKNFITPLFRCGISYHGITRHTKATRSQLRALRKGELDPRKAAAINKKLKALLETYKRCWIDGAWGMRAEYLRSNL